MKTYVAEIKGEAILAFRAEDDDDAQEVVHEDNGGLQLGLNGFSGLLRADGRALWDGTSPIKWRLASSEEHEIWRKSSRANAETAERDDWNVYLVPVMSVDEDDDEGEFA
jgi:hypothetical protein